MYCYIEYAYCTLVQSVKSYDTKTNIYARNVTRLILMQMNKLSFKKSVSNKNYHALFLSELIVYKEKCIVYHYGTSMHQFDYLAESNR